MEDSNQESEDGHGEVGHGEVRHYDEHKTMLRDAEFFQQHEKKLIKSNSSTDTGNDQSDNNSGPLPRLLITRFTELKLKASVAQYEHYIYQKYGLRPLQPTQ